jgi:hypothetical protein
VDDTVAVHEGPSEEMAVLWEAVVLSLLVRSAQTPEGMARAWTQFAGERAGVPFYLASLAPMFLSERGLRGGFSAALIAMGASTDEAARIMDYRNLEILVRAFALARSGEAQGFSMGDILDMAESRARQVYMRGNHGTDVGFKV